MWPNTQFPADLVTFTEEILNGKLQFLYSVIKQFWSSRNHLILLMHLGKNLGSNFHKSKKSSSATTAIKIPNAMYLILRFDSRLSRWICLNNFIIQTKKNKGLNYFLLLLLLLLFFQKQIYTKYTINYNNWNKQLHIKKHTNK